jgi:hypothetical protein
MVSTDPKAFFSYVQQDDRHDAGRLSHLRERLQGEIRLQTGVKIEIFQDVRDLNWGDRWKEKVLDAAAGALFLIPVITPAYFRSDPCRQEYEAFKALERRIGARGGFILPIYWVETDELSDPESRAGNAWAEELAANQWVDWRNLRLDSWEMTPGPNRRIEQMARQFKVRLKELGLVQPPGRGAIPTPRHGEASREIASSKVAVAVNSSSEQNATPKVAIPRDQTTGGNATNSLQVVAKCQDGSSSGAIGVTFKIYNLSNTAKQWSDIKVRYYFAGDGTVPVVELDHLQSLTKSSIVVTPMPNYVEIGFAPKAGALQAFDNISGSGEIQMSIHAGNYKPGWKTSQANHYSFVGCSTGSPTTFLPRPTMPATYRGQLAWGREP